ncbi:hypothetical protein SAMN05444372_107191 [Flavobacterium micromati]|uniref:Uncharacterized protein n=1 Tax=Flavobacterium micromati TaxID=229205 RepID=A0A1M5L2X9_9FLAO|nr:hypothetical protein [Flavobacterium micromati]SHG59462.1 hypothetical protein SAMN05444372_107191 [Flavobacterium micromati]
MVKITNLIPSQSDSFVRGLLKIVAVFAAFFISSCNDDLVEPATERLFTIQLGDKNYKLVNKWVGATKDCERLSIGFLYDQPDGHFGIDFNILKNGALHKATLVDFSLTGGQNLFDTADFNPVALMKITNFKYDEATNYVHFEYSGEVLQVISRSSAAANGSFARRFIRGVVTITNLDDYKCNTFLPTMQFETSGLLFTGTNFFGTHNPSLSSNPYRHIFYSNNGYRAIFSLKNNFGNLDKGKTYSFDQSTIENRIDLQKHIGSFRATNSNYNPIEDWKKFQTSGSYTIKEQVIINGKKVTKGEMNLQVYDNGMLIHTITNGTFEGVGL